MAEHSDMDELHEDLHGALRAVVTAAAAIGQQAARARAVEDDAERNRIIAAYQEAQAALAQVAALTETGRAGGARAVTTPAGEAVTGRAGGADAPAPAATEVGAGRPYSRTSVDELSGLDEETRAARVLSAQSYPLPVSQMLGRGPSRRIRHATPARLDGRDRGEELGR